MIFDNHIEDQVPFYIKRLKAVRHNTDKTLKIIFDFEGERDGLFKIVNTKEDDPYYGAFKIITDNMEEGVRLDMHCSGFYITRELKVERANQYQYSEHKVILDKKLTELTRLRKHEIKRRTLR